MTPNPRRTAPTDALVPIARRSGMAAAAAAFDAGMNREVLRACYPQETKLKITTSYDNPPIPDRSMDWSAVDSDTYDCDCDQDGFFSLGPVGRGRTEAEAIADLLTQIETAA